MSTQSNKTIAKSKSPENILKAESHKRFTNETLSQYYAGNPEWTVGYEDFGARYALGVRAQF